MQPQDPDQFGFILDPNQQKTSGPAILQDPKKRGIIMILFVSTVVLLAIIIGAFFFSLGGQKNSDLVELAAWQTELSRVVDIGLKDGDDPQIKAEAATMKSFIASDLQATTGYLASTGAQLKRERLVVYQNPQTTSTLSDAKQQNRFDEEYQRIINTTISNYKSSLQRALDTTSGPKRQQILETAAQNIITFENN